MEANKLECEKCIKIARLAVSDGDTDKAIRFLRKSLNLYPSDTAKSLLESLLKQKSNDEDDVDNGDCSNQTKENKQSSPQQSPKAHRRPTTTNDANTNANNSNSNTSSSTTTNKPKTSTDSYTSDQLDAVRRIKNCKDFYEILGVPRSANEADLKKQYKKLALQFHPDKNKAPGATEAFKAIGKAFAILTDTTKRKHYDLYGPESFDTSTGSSASRTRTSNTHRTSSYTNNNYWNDEDFSAEEIFNMFFGAGFGNNAAAHRHSRHHTNAQPNFVFTQSNNNYALLFQLMPIIMIVALSLLSSFMIGEPTYSLHKTNKYIVKRATLDHKVPYFVKNDFKFDSSHELNRLERQVEEDLLLELRQNCYREKSYKETAVWRARTYGDERLIKKAYEIDTPSCDKINTIFGAG